MRLTDHRERVADRVLWELDRPYAKSLGIDLSERPSYMDVPPAPCGPEPDPELRELGDLWNRVLGESAPDPPPPPTDEDPNTRI